MRYLVDTNILLRLVNATDTHHAVALSAAIKLHRDGEELMIAPQCVYEFWSVATRPASVGGLDLSTAEVLVQVARLNSYIAMVAAPLKLYETWLDLVAQHHVIGKQVHDARLAAFMIAHGIEHLLTFNIADFARFSPLVSAVHPAHL